MTKRTKPDPLIIGVGPEGDPIRIPVTRPNQPHAPKPIKIPVEKEKSDEDGAAP